MSLSNFLKLLLNTLSVKKTNRWSLTFTQLTVTFVLFALTPSGLIPELVHLTFQLSDSALENRSPLVTLMLNYALGLIVTLTILCARFLATLSELAFHLFLPQWDSLTRTFKPLAGGPAGPLNSIVNSLEPSASPCLEHSEIFNYNGANRFLYYYVLYFPSFKTNFLYNCLTMFYFYIFYRQFTTWCIKRYWIWQSFRH